MPASAKSNDCNSFLTDVLLFIVTLIGIPDIDGNFKVFLLLAFAVVGLIGFMAVVLKIRHRCRGQKIETYNCYALL